MRSSFEACCATHFLVQQTQHFTVALEHNCFQKLLTNVSAITAIRICRSCYCSPRITVPQSEGGGGPYSSSPSESVVLTVTGTRENVRVAQYLMQKVLKGK